ncbi:metallophosphoesterase family protein [Micromonospora eburnea]|uniref:Phosphoesterase, MJ0936 family n=1 Tax=Micromonospora eburnea TaxID=227316 RepID=A0A1C6UYN0_9ACTN|nr:metallophosphoesterase family protein [Micromonospora eburnea]SCL58954.1 phosphoesterase, MJ0936 family [Micromonospora eburnea]
MTDLTVDAAWHAAAEGEGPAPRFGPVERLAVLSDVHANVPALSAVLDEPEVRSADLVVFCGDLTWGSEPQRTAEIVQGLGSRAVLVRGNADRAVVELARGGRAAASPRDDWMPAQHSPATVDWLAGFPFTAVIEVTGLGAVRFCHGSPRSDTELLTPGTPPERLAEIRSVFAEPVLVSGHSHIQFDRVVAGLRNVNPGSLGLPYHDGVPGTAYWALFGPGVRLRRTGYDLAAAIAGCHRAGDPAADRIAGLLTAPPTVSEVTAHAEGLVFSD